MQNLPTPHDPYRDSPVQGRTTKSGWLTANGFRQGFYEAVGTGAQYATVVAIMQTETGFTVMRMSWTDGMAHAQVERTPKLNTARKLFHRLAEEEGLTQ